MTVLCTLKNDRGFTLVEAMMGMGLAVIVMGSLMGTFLAVKALNSVALGHLQAEQVVAGQVEILRGTGYAAVVSNGAGVATTFDAGEDAVWGTADDKTGNLQVEVADRADMDADGNTAEAFVDIDGDGANDAVVKPVRVSFSWQQKTLGQMKNYTMTADTLIAQ